MANVTFYRVVSQAEWQDIPATGQLRQGPNSVEGKHLTGSLEEAQRFAAKLFPSGSYRIVEVEFTKEVAEGLFFIGHMDLCGRVWFAELADLPRAVVREVIL